MAPTRTRTAIVGTGFMGRVHLEAVRRLGVVDVAAVVGSSAEKAQALAAPFGVETATADYAAVLRDRTIDAVHICTPNAQHFEMARAAIAAGKHILCEKPLARTSVEASALVELAAKTGVRHATCHNLRCYPMVQQMREMCAAGELGEILVVQGTYSQDWLLYDSDWNWRVEQSQAGALRAMGDIGTHWFDLVEHVTALRVSSLCADLMTVHDTRTRPRDVAETFAATGAHARHAGIKAPIDTEDFAGVLFRLGARARGSLTVSQVSAGRKNRLSVEIFGTIKSVAWDQERPNELWIGHRDRPNELLLKDPALLKPNAASYADLPGGHAEGYGDTFKQLFRRFYASIRDGAAPDYPQFTDGLRQMQLLDGVLASHTRRSWIDL